MDRDRRGRHGQLLGLLFVVGPLDWRAYMAAFVFFRIFDILKPLPAC